MIRCINCGYFLNCNKADENIRECEKFIKAQRDLKLENKEKLNFEFKEIIGE